MLFINFSKDIGEEFLEIHNNEELKDSLNNNISNNNDDCSDSLNEFNENEKDSNSIEESEEDKIEEHDYNLLDAKVKKKRYHNDLDDIRGSL